MRTVKSAVVGVVAVAVLCGACSSVDEPTTRACNQLAAAQNGFYNLLNAKSPDVVDYAKLRYPKLVSDAADEALGSSSGISSSFQNAKQNAGMFALSAIANSDGTVYLAGVLQTVQDCRDAGVTMDITELEGA